MHNDLMKKVGVTDWSQVNEEKAAKALLDSENITTIELSQLNAVIPDFINLARAGIIALQVVASNQGTSQRLALENHSKIIDSYAEIAAAMQSDEARKDMADRLSEAAATNKKINKDNNRSWIDTIKAVATVIVVVAVSAIGGKAYMDRS